ncbi:MAG: RagB/SusD family nutrient uptake outer membrane protein [Cyclobacteriaceae bacterium]|nr:RagB/SusD family nutrient uptake outer membrane protein [Cyclobacteriaceae bacterium HetDA_MAG_MS6]
MKILDYIKLLTLALPIGFVSNSCSDEFLDFTPRGVISSEELNTPANLERLVISAYATLGNDGLLSNQYGDMWVLGSVRSDDAFKGGGGISDQLFAHHFEVFSLNTPANGHGDHMWGTLYAALSRVNDALVRLQAAPTEGYPERDQRIAEMRFLRAHYFFILKIIYKFPVFVDENVPKEEVVTVSNRVLTDQQGWQLIVDEFRAAVQGLPATQADEGRPTSNAAKAYLAKSLLYKAYVQDDNHQVTTINTTELEEVVTLIAEIEASGEYQLHDDYAKNFLHEFESGVESVWAVMRSVDDGSPEGRGNYSTGLNSPMIAGYGCCSFNHASQNFINSFKTDAGGHPLFDTFNGDPQITDATDVMANTMDPRLGHTVGIIGMPWKYDPDRIYDDTYARVPGVYGFSLGMKDQELPESPSFRQYTAFFSISRNTDQIRYADVLLWKAEALIELNRVNEALPYINQIRNRAISTESLSRLAFSDGSPTGNWNVQPYTTLGDQDNARRILRYERRMEFGFES